MLPRVDRGPTRKITAILPADLLERAQQGTGRGIPETLVHVLEEYVRRQRLRELAGLAGAVEFELDLEQTRR